MTEQGPMVGGAVRVDDVDALKVGATSEDVVDATSGRRGGKGGALKALVGVDEARQESVKPWRRGIIGVGIEIANDECGKRRATLLGGLVDQDLSLGGPVGAAVGEMGAQ